jgi:putative ABC transport system permease protein
MESFALANRRCAPRQSLMRFGRLAWLVNRPLRSARIASIAVRNVVRQGRRALLTLVSICVGVASLVIAAGFIEDLLSQLRESTIHSQLGHLQVFAPGYVDSGRRDPLAHTLENPALTATTLRAIPDVAIVGGRLTFSGLLSNGRSDVPVMIEGVQASVETRIGSAIAMVAGTPLNSAGASGIVIGEGVASSLKLRQGDPVTLLASTREGALNTFDTRIDGVFRSPFKDYDAHAVRMNLADAQSLVNGDILNSIVVLLRNTSSTDAALEAARHALPTSTYDVRPWWELADFYVSTESLYQRQFLVLQVIVALMVLLGVANSVNMMLHERRAEFGTVRALGYRAGSIFTQILLETALLGAAGAIAGVALGIVLGSIISAVGIDMPPPPNSDVGYTATIRLTGWNLLTAAGSGVLAAIAGCIFPARHLARMPIVEALRYGA